MSKRWPRIENATVIAALWLLAGCSSSESTVSGKVLLNGKPLDTGTVTFHPVAEGAAAYGQVQADGTYQIKTGRKRGLQSGQFKVTVVATKPSTPSSDELDEPLPELLTPKEYGSLDQTPLRFSVLRGANHIDIQLSGQRQASP